MSIRLSGAQRTRIHEAFQRFVDNNWLHQLATEDFVEDILKIVLPKENYDHQHEQEPRARRRMLSTDN